MDQVVTENKKLVPLTKILSAKTPSGKNQIFQLKNQEEELINNDYLEQNPSLKNFIYPMYLLNNTDPKEYESVTADDLKEKLTQGINLSEI